MRPPRSTLRFRHLAAFSGAVAALWAAAGPVASAEARAPATAAAPAAPHLPSLGDSDASDMTVGTERKLGDQIMREVRRDPDYLDDPVLLEYVQTSFASLVSAARQRGDIGADLDSRFAWEAFLVRDRSINAFALPGGYVGVHLGLIAMTSTRDELASVLAHELIHVTQRHIARSIASSKRSTLLGTAAMILGVLAASRTGSADMAQAAIAGGQAAMIQGQLNFSRDMEREADRIGLALMSPAGFAPDGMAGMFEKLEHAARLSDRTSYPYLRSHPLTSERIGEARSRLGTARRPAGATVVEHALARARARVLMDTRVDALRRWQALDPDGVSTADAGERMAAAYSSTLASALLRDGPRADAMLGRLKALAQTQGPQDRRLARGVALLEAQVALERGDAVAADAAMRRLAGDTSRPVLLLRARTALAGAGASGAADAEAIRAQADMLSTWLASHPADAEGWTTSAQLWARLQQPLRSLRAEAEARYALGDLTGAADRLRAGQRMAREGNVARPDFIEASVIDARLRQIETERKELQAEERRQGG